MRIMIMHYSTNKLDSNESNCIFCEIKLKLHTFREKHWIMDVLWL